MVFFFVLLKTEHMEQPQKKHPRLFLIPPLNMLCFCDGGEMLWTVAVITSISRQAQTITEVSEDCLVEKHSNPRFES